VQTSSQGKSKTFLKKKKNDIYSKYLDSDEKPVRNKMMISQIIKPMRRHETLRGRCKQTHVRYLENCAENDGDTVRFGLHVHSFVIPTMKIVRCSIKCTINKYDIVYFVLLEINIVSFCRINCSPIMYHSLTLPFFSGLLNRNIQFKAGFRIRIRIFGIPGSGPGSMRILIRIQSPF